MGIYPTFSDIPICSDHEILKCPSVFVRTSSGFWKPSSSQKPQQLRHTHLTKLRRTFVVGILHLCRRQGKTRWVFNGGWVDNGRHCYMCVCFFNGCYFLGSTQHFVERWFHSCFTGWRDLRKYGKIWEKNTLGICHRKMLWGENDEKPLGSAVLGISANAWNAEVNQMWNLWFHDGIENMENCHGIGDYLVQTCGTHRHRIPTWHLLKSVLQGLDLSLKLPTLLIPSLAVVTMAFNTLSVCLSSYLSVYLSIYLAIYLSICLSIYLSVCLSIYRAIYLSICLSIYLSIYLAISLSVCLSVCLSIYLSSYLSIHLSVHLSACLSI